MAAKRDSREESPATKYMRWREYDQSWRNYCRLWDGFDSALYHLCEATPLHQVLKDVIGKVGLISRSYVAGLERRGKAKGDEAIIATAQILRKRHREVDSVLDRLRKIAGNGNSLSVDSLMAIVKAHKMFLDLVRQEMRGKASVRSFISKYIHFHVPATPLYDSQGNWVLRKSYPLRGKRNSHILSAVADPEYLNFCNRFYSLWLDAKNRALPVTVRRLDQHIRWCFRKLPKKRKP